MRALVEGGIAAPICPELTNANPSAPHTVLLEAQSWLVAQLTRRINILPRRDQIEFARLFGIELREASPATAALTFTVAAPSGVAVTVPAGTKVTTADERFAFLTDANLIIPAGAVSGTISATCTTAGRTYLSANTVVLMDSALAYVTDVTNPAEVNSGANDETIDQALTRARNYQRRGERLVSAQDFEDAIREDILFNNGIVKAFPFIDNGDWENLRVGHTTIVVMTDEGAPVSDDIKRAINELLMQAVGNQFIYVLDPTFVNFDVAAQVVIGNLVSPSATIAGIEQNLRNFYAARLGKFGVPALRSEIAAVIEGSAGVEHINPQGNSILISPLLDVSVSPFQLVKLNNVVITVAG